ncbi:MAG: GNAT family N-acetyltransferase [Pseudomonadota bacterium]
MVDIRPITENELDAFVDLMDVAYLGDTNKDRRENYRKINELDRSFGAFDGDQLVGTISAYSFDLTVPGHRTLPMGGTTVVAVRPTHRRRGILRRMIEVHLDDVRRHAEPLAGLWASEASIYGRFGYGCAIDFVMFDIRSNAATIDGPIDDRVEIRMVDKTSFAEAVPLIYEATRTKRPGALTRKSDWWNARRLAEPSGSDGASSYRYALAEREGQPVGYVYYRTKDVDRDGVAAGEVHVVELLGLDVDAELALWRFLFGIDLTTTVKARFRTMDDPLLFRLNDRRAIKVFVSDAVHLRLMDVPAALAGRSYTMPGALTIELTNHADIQGIYRLEVDADGVARCDRSDGAADISLDARTLAACYLGGCRINALAGAGHIGGSFDAISLADRMFVGECDPIAREIF